MPNVLVTGTSTGIGHACATLLAARGWTVFAGVRRAEDAERLSGELAGDVRPLILDVCDRDDVARAITTVRETVGASGLQGLVNNRVETLSGTPPLAKRSAWRWSG